MAKDMKNEAPATKPQGVQGVPPQEFPPPVAPPGNPPAGDAKVVKKKPYRASDDMRVVGHIQKELETLPRHAQEKVLAWVNKSMADGTIKAVPSDEPRPDQPPLPFSGDGSTTK